MSLNFMGKMELKIRAIPIKYVLKPFFYLPITFIKRILFGSDLIAKQYFWNKWGYIDQNIVSRYRDKKIVWIDVSSGGEVIQIITLCKLIKAHFPEMSIFLSTESKDAYFLAKSLETIDFVFFSPWDLKGPVKRTLKKINPIILVAVEFTELAILFREAKKRGVKTLLISGYMSDHFLTVQQIQRALALKYVFYFDMMGVKTAKDFEVFLKLGVAPEKMVISGDLKCDLDSFRITSPRILQYQMELGSGVFFLAASVRAEESEIMMRAYLLSSRVIPKLKFIIAPRFNEDVESVVRLLKKNNLMYMKLTELNKNNLSNILLIDTFGDLRQFFRIVDYVFIGASLIPYENEEGHNPLEALLCNKPIIFGPYMNRWSYFTTELKSIWKNCEIQDDRQLANSIIELYYNKALYETLQKKAAELTMFEVDPVKENLSLLTKLLKA